MGNKIPIPKGENMQRVRQRRYQKLFRKLSGNKTLVIRQNSFLPTSFSHEKNIIYFNPTNIARTFQALKFYRSSPPIVDVIRKNRNGEFSKTTFLLLHEFSHVMSFMTTPEAYLEFVEDAKLFNIIMEDEDFENWYMNHREEFLAHLDASLWIKEGMLKKYGIH